MSCWVCDSSDLKIAYPGLSPDEIETTDFRITDKNYGTALTVSKCQSCGFMFCTEAENVTSFYEEMDDPDYDEGREERIFQARRLLSSLGLENTQGASLLDVGAGVGISLQAANEMGYRTVGVEPSRALSQAGRDRDLDIRTGTLEEVGLTEKFDVVLLVDVIEHVTNPGELLKQCRQVMKDGGVLLVVTPDISSFASKVLGKNWWHVRVAHVGYFNRRTFLQLAEREHLQLTKSFRPTWYFSVGYLFERLSSYIPPSGKLAEFGPFKQLTVPLNLLDSLAFVLHKQPNEQ